MKGLIFALVLTDGNDWRSKQVAPYELYEGALRMDGPTLQNLEILATQDGGRRGSLLDHLDSCHSAGL